MPWIIDKNPTALERVIAGVCYLTAGLAGLLYIIISGRSGQSSFFRFHFLQSIILYIIGLLLSWASGILLTLVGGMLGMIDNMSPGLGVQIGSFLGVSIDIGLKVGFLLLLYGMIFAFLGKYAEIPFISNLVRQQMR
ncbi:MAG TPA: hypothetical protein V6D08_10305 [Candidatus Obscuribacterales bacterium]|jgi:uncharacterized membrane protein